MVISGLKKLTVETPDQPGWMGICSFFISDRYYQQRISVLTWTFRLIWHEVANREQNIRVSKMEIVRETVWTSTGQR